MERVEREGLSDRIRVIHGDARRVTLPEKADVCVSEIFESVAGAEGAAIILDAVRGQLAPGHRMVPAVAATLAGAVSLAESLRRAPRFDPVAAYYVQRVFEERGRPFDVRLCLKGATPEMLLTPAGVFEELDLQAGTQPAPRRVLTLRFERDGVADGFLLWLRLEMPGGRVLDTLETSTSWFPAYVPAFEGGARVREGDTAVVECEHRLSADGVHPDYALRGVLHRRDAAPLEFGCDLAYAPDAFRAGGFYRQLFAPDGAPARWPTADAAELRRHLSRTLPPYMVPARFTQVDRLPLTPNGKLDRAALPGPAEARPETTGEYVAPRTEAERRLAALWERVLGVRPVGVRDSFFELGGHSIAAVRVVEAVRRELGRTLPLASLYRDETVEQLAVHLERQATGTDR
uniref:Non-ribosomal peptide synthetase n=1 Tax=uncultured bacterium AB_1383 TaxID=1630010 RepID=A0A0E3JNN8_9BACT|nr:non-ribosomal peptide synthetase [uncultured bacterium AB_1383]